MKIRFLLHNVYGRGGGVLTVTLRLAQDLSGRHDVEIINVIRSQDEPVMDLPVGVPITTLVDCRASARRGGVRGRVDAWARGRPSRLIHPDDPRFTQYSLYSDIVLLRFLWSSRRGVLVAMQPGLNLATARFGRRGCVRVAQDHRPFVGRSKSVHAAYTRYVPRLDCFLTLTEQDASGYRREIGPAARVEAMTNGTPTYAGTPSDHASKVVLAAGRLERTKGFDLLIDAWSQVAARHPDWELRIFGSGRLRDRLQQQIQALGLEDSVRLMGFSNRLHDEMAASSVFVLSSRREGYGMVLVEAMSAGVPVVSFDCPTGPASIISHEEDGLLVPNEDVEGLGKAILHMIDIGEEGRRRFAEAGLENAHRRSQPVVSAYWERLLSELLAAKRRRGRTLRPRWPTRQLAHKVGRRAGLFGRRLLGRGRAG